MAVGPGRQTQPASARDALPRAFFCPGEPRDTPSGLPSSAPPLPAQISCHRLASGGVRPARAPPALRPSSAHRLLIDTGQTFLPYTSSACARATACTRKQPHRARSNIHPAPPSPPSPIAPGSDLPILRTAPFVRRGPPCSPYEPVASSSWSSRSNSIRLARSHPPTPRTLYTIQETSMGRALVLGLPALAAHFGSLQRRARTPPAFPTFLSPRAVSPSPAVRGNVPR